MSKDVIKAETLRGRSRQDLLDEMRAVEKDLFNIRFRGLEGEKPDVTRPRKLRRNLARFLTVLREMELGIQPGKTPRRPKLTRRQRKNAKAASK